MTVLADGAKWIWEEQRKHLMHAGGALDIFHAWQHAAETAKAVDPEKNQADARTESARAAGLGSLMDSNQGHLSWQSLNTQNRKL